MTDHVNGRTYPNPQLYVTFQWNGKTMLAFKVDDGILFTCEDETEFVPPDKIHVKGDEFLLSSDSTNPLNLDLDSRKMIWITFSETVEYDDGQTKFIDDLWGIETRDLYKDIESFCTLGQKYEDVMGDHNPYFTAPLRF